MALLCVKNSSYLRKVKLNPSISIIGYKTDAGEGKHLVTCGGNKHVLVAQGWNHMKK